MPVMGVDVGKTTATIVLACAAFATGMWAMYHQHGQFAMLLLSMLLTSLIVCVHTDWFEEWLED